MNFSERPGDPHEFAFLQIRPLVFGGELENVDLDEIEPGGADLLSR